MAHAGCQLVNCGFRKLVVEHESKIKRLQAERDALSQKVAELIKEKQDNVLVTVLKPDEQPVPVATRIIYPLSMANLPPIEQAVKKKRGRADANKGPPKPWKIKRVLRELAALFATKTLALPTPHGAQAE